MSCGPVNSLQVLSNHTQVDRSLHQDYQQQLQGTRSQQFRQIQQNHQLDKEFQQQFNPIFQNAFLGSQNIQPQPMLHQTLANAQQQQQQQQSEGWANDFAKLSLYQLPQQPQNQEYHAPQSDWSSQFMNHIPQQYKTPQVTPTPMPYANQFLYRNTNSMVFEPQVQKLHMNEHRELHHHEILASELDNEFEQLEKELQPRINDESMKQKKDPGFKNAAKEIVDAMSTSKNSKFFNSDFLKLMSMVSSGKVEVNNDNTKLVDENGNDIHEVKSENSAFENIQNAPEEEEELSDTNNHLPDPLQGLTAEDLTSSYAGASRVAELRGDKYTWDDVYSDYKNDDTNF